MNDLPGQAYNQAGQNHVPPGAAPSEPGVSPTSNLSSEVDNPQKHVAPGSVSQDAAQRGPGRDGNNQSNLDDPEQQAHPWAPPGDAVLTTREARLYLYDQYDMLLQPRRIQKFKDEDNPHLLHRKLLGEVEPKKEGGVHLLLAKSSLDAFGQHDQNQHYRNAKDTALDPTDPDFDDLRKIAAKKPYGVTIEGAAPVTPPPRPEVPEDADSPVDELEEEESIEKKGRAGDAPGYDPVGFLKQQFEYFKNLFEEEKSNREATEQVREKERTQYQQKFEEHRQAHDRELVAMQAELTIAYNAYINTKLDLQTMHAALNEAKSFVELHT